MFIVVVSVFIIVLLLVGCVLWLCGLVVGWLFCGCLLLLLWWVLVLLGCLFRCIVRVICLCWRFIFSIFIFIMLFVFIMVCGFFINLFDNEEMWIRLFWCMLILINVLKLVMLVIVFLRIIFGCRLFIVLMLLVNWVVLNFGCGLWFGFFSFLMMLVIVGILNFLLVKLDVFRLCSLLLLFIRFFSVCCVVVRMCFIIG